MMIRTESTTDSPEEMQRAYEALGLEAEISTFEDGLNAPPTPETDPGPEQTGAPVATSTEPGASETPAPNTQDATAEDELEQAILDETLPKGVRARVQKILAKATADKYKAQADRSEAEALLNRARTGQPPAAEPPAAETQPGQEAAPAETPAPEAAAKPKPKMEDFAEAEDPIEAFIEALTDWKTDQKKAEIHADIERRDTEAIAQAEAGDWHNSVRTAGKEKYSDWEELSNKPETANVKFSAPLMFALSDTGDPVKTADYVHYLTTHPDEAAELYKLTNHDDKATPAEIIRKNQIVGRKLVEIEGKLTAPKTVAPAAPAPPATPKPRVTQAPPPIAPVHGSAPSSAPTPYERPMSPKEYRAWFATQFPGKR